jgi:hypothetical protein
MMSVDVNVLANADEIQQSFHEKEDWNKYNGLRIKDSVGPAVYLVLNGMKRHIPNPNTYNSLFANWNNIVISDYLVDQIPAGDPLSNGAVLIKGSSPLVCLGTNGQKLPIPSEAVFNKYYFAWNKIHTIPDEVFNSVPTGPVIV